MSTYPNFGEHVIIAEAREKAGLQDFGDESFRKPMRMLLKSLEEEANLNAIGRITQHQRIVDILINRLRAEDYFKRFPEILNEEIKAPIVIVGLPRTGTTMLQRIIAEDQRLYSVRFYESRNPAPFPTTNFIHRDPRISETETQVNAIIEGSPKLISIHPFDALAAEEEILLLEHSFLSTVTEALVNVPKFGVWLNQQDHTEGYVYLKKMLQFLQWQKKKSGQYREGWVLKTAHHLGHMDLLFKIFPDARIVQTHRDPLQAVPSLVSKIVSLWVLTSDQVDPTEAGRQWSNKMANVIKKCMKIRDQYPDRFIDVWYLDAAKEPMSQIRRIYDFIGFPMTDTAEKAMRDWALTNAREKRPPHNFTLEEFGLSEEQIKVDFAEYREKYILPHL